MSTVFFIGPLPPPVHGFSAINELMAQRLRVGVDLLVFDRKPSSFHNKTLRLMASIIKTFTALIRFFFFACARRGCVYIGLSGGRGQAIDLIYLVIARALAHPVFVHHHSFAYLNIPTVLSKACMLLSMQQRHITLCDCMADILSQTYGISLKFITALSNSAFLTSDFEREGAPSTAIERSTESRLNAPLRIRVGFLSNISAEKGIFDFFDVLDRLSASFCDVEASIAGPVAPEIKDSFEKRLSKISNARHLGPIYGQKKVDFFENIDLLLFPSRYANEAEPVTLIEAMAAGIFVVATNRGCIAHMIPAEAGKVVDIQHFTDEAVAVISSWRPSVTHRNIIKLSAWEHHQIAKSRLDGIIKAISPQVKNSN